MGSCTRLGISWFAIFIWLDRLHGLVAYGDACAGDLVVKQQQ